MSKPPPMAKKAQETYAQIHSRLRKSNNSSSAQGTTQAGRQKLIEAPKTQPNLAKKSIALSSRMKNFEKADQTLETVTTAGGRNPKTSNSKSPTTGHPNMIPAYKSPGSYRRKRAENEKPGSHPETRSKTNTSTILERTYENNEMELEGDKISRKVENQSYFNAEAKTTTDCSAETQMSLFLKTSAWLALLITLIGGIYYFWASSPEPEPEPTPGFLHLFGYWS